MATPDLSWLERAACKDMDGDIFFSRRTSAFERFNYKAAMTRCWSECPVRSECLNYALLTDQPYGIWGGLSRKERKKLQGPHRKRLRGVA